MQRPIVWRHYFVMVALLLVLLVLLARALQLQVLNREFYVGQGNARQQRTVEIPAHRGMILDRNGDPLAMSTPVDSVWANPQHLLPSLNRIAEIANVIEIDVDALKQRVVQARDREFIYIKRHLAPHVAQAVLDLDLPGVALQREYRRYYPAGEVVSHLLGFTDIDDHGQEGLELAYDAWLAGAPGEKRIVRDRLGRPVADIELIRAAEAGQDLQLSIDRRIQYLAYRALKSAVQEHHAVSGSVVMLDVTTGEVLAIANQPGFNPNNRKELQGEQYRNRAITDVFEPGSTIKPITVAMALESGHYQFDSILDLSPGRLRVGRHWVKDIRDYGWVGIADVIKKSSNVGASKLALSVAPEFYWQTLDRFGFGKTMGSGFPGETLGYLPFYDHWSTFEQATLAFGYGLSVSALQLAYAYSAIANDGERLPLTFRKQEQALSGSERVISAKVAARVRGMMRAVVTTEGTAPKAKVMGYSVAGKTGTVHKTSAQGGYDKDRYSSLFVGMAPAQRPRVLTVVVLNEPQGQYFGGQVAAPVFSQIMGGALRLLGVVPDNLPNKVVMPATQKSEVLQNG